MVALRHLQIIVRVGFVSTLLAGAAAYADHWAFVAPIKAPLPPTTQMVSDSPVDAFIEARLEKEGLAMSPVAPPHTLCRRVYLDLIGLLPSLAQLDAFEKDAAEHGDDVAVNSLVSTLLRRPHFGERWARPWLDAARYSDSNGYEKDLPRDQWAWRDWVINAINGDMPYDQFVIEQVAGDLLPHRTAAQLIATGFLRNGMTNEEGAIVPEQFRMDGMYDRIDTIGKSVLGLSVQCAQCHTHKFDPITQDEYYGIFAFLNNTYEAQSWVYSAAQEKKIHEIRAGIAAVEQRLKTEHPDWKQKLADWEAGQLREVEKINWTLVDPTDLHSSTGLNHPVTLPDKSILTLGHKTINGDLLVTAEPNLAGVTGIRLEALTHGDLPFGGPGRSFKGTWAVTEFIVEAQKPGSAKWEPLAMKNATADFSEAEHTIEPEWAAGWDKENKRLCGPVAFMIDGKDGTGWRADRGPGRRNTDSVAVVQFEKPLDFPEGTKLRFSLRLNHGGDDNGPKNAMLGHFRVALTTDADPKVNHTPYAAVLAMQVPAASRTVKQKAEIFAAWRASVAELKPFNEEIEVLWKEFPEAETSVLHLAERTGVDVRETHRLDRGVWDRPKEAVAPHVPAAFHQLPAGAKPDRLTFARWLADKNSPFTARVEVNRIWQTLFGTGLVETSEDFGTRAPTPVYRDLLDWLAVDLVEHGWSRKHVIGTILASRVYRQSSRATPELLERDPRDQLMARSPRFRPDAEIVRDMVLDASGLMTDKVGGPSFFPPVPESVLAYNYFKPVYWITAEGAERHRRSLYMFRKRSMPDPALSVFDAPNGDVACSRRGHSNTPLAALTALNEPVFIEAAQALALRIIREGGKSEAEHADFAFRVCTGRLPQPAEREEILSLIKSVRPRLADGWLSIRDIMANAGTGDAPKLPPLPAGVSPQDVAAWTIAARVVLNLDETLCRN